MELAETQTGNKIHMPRRRQFFILIPFALFYSAAAILGELEEVRAMGVMQNLGRFILWSVGSYVVLLIMCFIISERSAIASKIPLFAAFPARKSRRGKWYVYVLFTLACLLCYMPYFLMYYPTWLSNDAVWQIEQVLGWAAKSNHHPYFHTLILKCFFLIGYRLSGTYTGGAAFFTFSQMVIMAMVFSFFLYWLYRRGTRAIWLVLAFAFYAVLPINDMMTIYMGKDELFTASMLFFVWMTAEFDLDADMGEGTEHKTGRKKILCRRGTFIWTAYFVVGLLVCLLRSNGVFIFAGTAFFLVISKIHKAKLNTVDTPTKISPIKTFLCAAAVLLCYLFYRGPILGVLHVEQPDTIEGLTMPTQHVLCALLKGGEFTAAEIEMIDQVVPVDKAEEYYNPRLFDPMKNFIRTSGDQQVIADNKWEYFKLWLRVGLRNPLQYVVAEVRQTAGYWAYSVPDYEYVYGEYFMVENPFGITTQRKLFSYDNELAMHDFLMGFQDLYNKVWSLGLNTWLMVFGIAYMVYERKSIMVYVPFIMMLVTLLLATPVYNEFRYAYGLFAAFPMLAAYSLEKETV